MTKKDELERRDIETQLLLLLSWAIATRATAAAVVVTARQKILLLRDEKTDGSAAL